jgi:hypothetical protein
LDSYREPVFVANDSTTSGIGAMEQSGTEIIFYLPNSIDRRN